jgi:hypothetical protein
MALDHAQLKDQAIATDVSPAAGRGEQSTPSAPQIAPPEKTPIQKRCEAALRDLILQAETRTDVIRRHHVRRMLQAEEFWKGNHHLIWDEDHFRWHTPFEVALQESIPKEDLPRFQYVVNIYQAYGLGAIAAMSQKVPKSIFQPKSVSNEIDVATANAARSVADVIERNNNLKLMAIRKAYLAWTQGGFGSYVRYVVDKKFGTHQEPIMRAAQVEIEPERVQCQNCGAVTPTDQLGSGYLAGMPACPQCGNELRPEDVQQQETGEGYVISGVKDFADGQEVISIVPFLNLKLEPQANEQRQSGYIIWCEEVQKAFIRAAHPAFADQVGPGPGTNAEDTYERNARLRLIDSTPGYRNTSAFEDLVTYKRAWVRNEYLWGIDDSTVRQMLVEQFPEGVYVSMAGDTIFEMRNEDPDDSWSLCVPMPGQGIYREAIGSSSIPINEMLNDNENMAAEHTEFAGAPPVLFNARQISGDALKKRRVQPGNFVPAMPGDAANPGAKMSEMFFQPEFHIDANIYSRGKTLMEFVQVLSGVMPSVLGGQLQGNDTATGYKTSIAQSMGKLNLFWTSIKEHDADCMKKAVECFRRNRTSDYESVVTGKTGEFVSKWIHLDQLKGNITVQAEADEDFPSSWAEQRQNILDLAKVFPQEVALILQDPANYDLAKRVIASPSIVFPQEADREKQMREIDRLLKQKPVPAQDGLGMSSSVPPVMLGDDHDVHIKTTQEWLVSDEGIEAMENTPQGFDNCVSHILDHFKAKAQLQKILAQINGPPQPPPGSNPPGGPGNAPGDPGKPAEGPGKPGNAPNQPAPPPGPPQ